MQKFITLQSVAAYISLVNIDTDMIIPKQFLKTIKRTGLGQNLFYEMRYDLNGNEIPDFILNQPAYKKAQIIIAGNNFGCGSSREHAPWALSDFGIKCIIAPSFADIFYNNCFKNGILPLVLDIKTVDELMQLAKNETNLFNIDLINQQIKVDDKIYQFDINNFKKMCLLEGLDDIGLTLKKADKISSFEANNQKNLPWL